MAESRAVKVEQGKTSGIKLDADVLQVDRVKEQKAWLMQTAAQLQKMKEKMMGKRSTHVVSADYAKSLVAQVNLNMSTLLIFDRLS